MRMKTQKLKREGPNFNVSMTKPVRSLTIFFPGYKIDLYNNNNNIILDFLKLAG